MRHLCRCCEESVVERSHSIKTAARRLVAKRGINERKQKNPNETRNGAADGLSGHGRKWICHQ